MYPQVLRGSFLFKIVNQSGLVAAGTHEQASKHVSMIYRVNLVCKSMSYQYFLTELYTLKFSQRCSRSPKCLSLFLSIK